MPSLCQSYLSTLSSVKNNTLTNLKPEFMNLKFVTIPQNLLKFWFSGKIFKLNHHFHWGAVPISQY